MPVNSGPHGRADDEGQREGEAENSHVAAAGFRSGPSRDEGRKERHAQDFAEGPDGHCKGGIQETPAQGHQPETQTEQDEGQVDHPRLRTGADLLHEGHLQGDDEDRVDRQEPADLVLGQAVGTAHVKRERCKELDEHCAPGDDQEHEQQERAVASGKATGKR